MPFVPRSRCGSGESPGEGGAGGRLSCTVCSSTASRAAEAAAAARKRSRNESGSTGRSTRVGGRAPFVPRVRRGSAEDVPAGSPGADLEPGAGFPVSGAGPSRSGGARAASAGRSAASGDCRDGGTRPSSRMRDPPGGVSGTPTTAVQRSTCRVTFQGALLNVVTRLLIGRVPRPDTAWPCTPPTTRLWASKRGTPGQQQPVQNSGTWSDPGKVGKDPSQREAGR